MVKRCEEMGVNDMKLVHTFYIGMLALRYRTDTGERVLWPNQYQWLLEERLVDWKDHDAWGLSEENIHDKSNADSTVKVFALLQVLWFVAQCIMRAVHHLPLSQIESMTLSYVPLFAVTYFFWWMKPKDVLTPSVVDLPTMTLEQKSVFEAMAVSNAFDGECVGQRESLWKIWKLTPRVFEKEAMDKAAWETMQAENLSLECQKTATVDSEEVDVERGEAQNMATVLKRMATGLDDRRNSNDGGDQYAKELVHGQSAYAKETVVAYWDPEIYHSKMWPITCLFGISFGALHLINWYTHFPTQIELWLWRIAAIVSIVSMLIFMQYEKVVLKWGGPLTLLSILSPAFYLGSRLVMIGLVVAAFRAMDPRIYETYVASTYWVHVL